MHPFFCKSRFRTGLCSGMILFAIVLRLALVPGLPGRFWDGLVRTAGRPGVIRAVFFLETGLRVNADNGTQRTDGGPPHPSSGFRETPDATFPSRGRLPAGDESMAAVGSGHYGAENGASGAEDESMAAVGSDHYGTENGASGAEDESMAAVGSGHYGVENGASAAEDESMAAVGSGHYGAENRGGDGATGDGGGEETPPHPSASQTPSPQGEGSLRGTGDRSRRAGFSAEEAEEISLRGNCTYAADKAALLLRPLGWTRSAGPSVLIVHTHSCEAYTPSDGWEYKSEGNYRTLDPARSVIAVGDALAEELEKRGVEVIHDRAYNDYPDYNRSYASAREHILKDLAEHPSIRVIIDLHRDAMEQPVREVTELDGQTVAKLMLVVGTDEGGLSHPHWPENLSCALKLQALANRSAPGLFKSISFRRERFNGDLCPGEMIVEVGSTGNSLPEAIAAMPYLAQALAELLEVD